MNIFHRAAAVGILGMLCLAAGAPSAAAVADSDAPVAFVDPSLTVEYGEYWKFAIDASPNFLYRLYRLDHYTLSTTGTPSGYKPNLYLNADDSNPGTNEPSGYLYPPYESVPLGPGSYTFTLSGSGSWNGEPLSGSTTPPARLTVSKAALHIDLRAIPDPNRPDAAIVTAELTGRFIDDYNSYDEYYYESTARAELPTGEWSVVISDDAGTVVEEFGAVTEDAAAASFYWTEAEDDTVYVATATFTPTGATAKNFSANPAEAFSFTPGRSTRPLPTSTAVSSEALVYTGEGGFSLPLWVVVVTTLLLAGLGAVVTVFSLRLRRAIRPAVEVVK